MAKFIVRSYVSVETEIEAEDYDSAVDQAGNKIFEALKGNHFDFDFFEEAVVFDEDGDQLEAE